MARGRPAIWWQTRRQHKPPTLGPESRAGAQSDLGAEVATCPLLQYRRRTHGLWSQSASGSPDESPSELQQKLKCALGIEKLHLASWCEDKEVRAFGLVVSNGFSLLFELRLVLVNEPFDICHSRTRRRRRGHQNLRICRVVEWQEELRDRFRRSVREKKGPAMAVTLVVFEASRYLVASYLRPFYQVPLTDTWDPAQGSSRDNLGDWAFDVHGVDSAGRRMNQAQLDALYHQFRLTAARKALRSTYMTRGSVSPTSISRLVVSGRFRPWRPHCS